MRSLAANPSRSATAIARLLPLLANMTQITRHSRAGAALLIAILAVVLFAGPPASAQSGNGGLDQVTVSFRADLYIVQEGGTRTIEVRLSDDPGREVIIPITATDLGGAVPADYSGVPQTVTFGRAAECFDSVGDIIQGGICYETTADITITAAQDDDDDGERVLLGFGAPLPAGVSAGWPATETVTISDGGLAFVGLAQVGMGVTAAVGDFFGNVSNEAWQWQRSATEYGAYSDIAAAEGGTSNPYTPSAGDLGMWLKAKVTYDVGSRTGQTEQATTLQSVLSQAALSNAGFAHANEVSYVLDTPPATPKTPLYAQGFTTGSDNTNGYLLTAVRLAIRLHGLTAAGAWAVHADDAGKPAAQPLSAALPILVPGISPEHFTFREFAHPDGVRVDPDTKYWIVISQTTPIEDGPISIDAWSEWTGSLEEGLAAPPVDPGSADGWSVDFEALSYYWDAPNLDDDDILRPDLLPWQRFGYGVELGGRMVLRMALRAVPAVTVSFGQGTYTVAEGATQSVTVTLSADPERTVVVPIATVNQGTTSDTDYSGVPSSVTFDAGETSKSFDFSATQDTEDDDGESVQLVFGSLPDAALSAGAPGATTINITDDDVPAVTVTFGQGSYTVAEGATQSVTVTLSADPERTVVVPIATVNQGTTSDTDYSGVPSSVTFDAGETSKSFDFSATQDTEDDDGESVQLGFGSMPDARVSAGTPDETTVNITDDDVPAVTVQFSQGSYTVAEGATQSVTVTLSANPERTVIIPITTVNQGTASDADYSGVPSSVTFDAGETSKSFDFSATQDTEDDDGESVQLGFGSMPDARVSAGTPDETTVNITDDDLPAVTVSFGQGTYTVAEGATQSVTVTLSADPERTLAIPIEATNQGGATSADYSGVPPSVTFNDGGPTEMTFTFTAVDDTLDDDDESVKLAFGTLPDEVSAVAPDETTVNITDDDVPSVTVSFGQGTYTVAEGATQSLTVTLSANPERTVIIPITTVNQGTASDADYSGVPSSVTFDFSAKRRRRPSPSTSPSVTFNAEQDTEDDDGESVLLGFGSMPDARVSAGTPDETTVNITDDDVPSVTVSFGQGTYTVAEGATQSLTVTLSGDPKRTVIIPITTVNQGTASDADYSGVPPSVTFNDGGPTEMTFTFTAVDDTLDDDDESVKLGFGSLPDRVSAGAPAETTVNITDDDVPSVTVSFGQASYTVAEGATQSVTVTLSGDPERTLVIPIEATNQGGATSADYSGVPPSVTFNDGGPTEMTFTFTAVDDTLDDDDESVKLGFGSLPDRVSAGAPAETTVNITDDDVPAVTVTFGQGTYTVAEGATQSVTVTLSADPERSVDIPITTVNQGTASDADYSGVPSSVTFLSGETSKSFDFMAEQDTEDDDGESVLLGFGSMPDARVSAGTPDETTVNITDDDVPSVTVSFGQGTYTVAEGATQSLTVTLSADPERTVIIPITTVNQGTTSDADYSGVPSSVTFQSGETEKTITFTAVDDALNDDGERVRLGFGSLPDRVSAGTPDETTVNITDDDVPSVTVEFEASAYTVAESDDTTTPGVTENEVEVTVTLSANPERTVTIPITKVNQGTASDGDYSGVPSSVTFQSGETSKSFDFMAEQDTEDDDGESVLLTFGTLPPDVSAGTPTATTVTITDDDAAAGKVALELTPATINESGAGNASTVTASIPSGSSAATTVTVSVNPADTTTLTGNTTLTIPAGDTNSTGVVTITSVNDDAYTGNLMVTVSGTAVNSVGVTNPDDVTLTIREDDAAAGKVALELTPATINESGTGNASTVTATIQSASSAATTVTVSVNPADTTTLTGNRTLTIPAGDTNSTGVVTITAVNDDAYTGNRTVAVSGTAVNGVGVTDPDNVTLTIREDDEPRVVHQDDDPAVLVNFGSAAYSVPEGGTVEVTVTLSADPESTVTVPLTVTEQYGASSPQDYSEVPASVTFDAGQMSRSFTFSAAQDTVDDDNGESVKLTFGTLPARLSAGTVNESTVNIRDDDAPVGCDSGDIWCATVEYTDSFPSDAAGRKWLTTGYAESNMFEFVYKGMRYELAQSSLGPNPRSVTPPRPPFHIPERSKSLFSIHNLSATDGQGKYTMPNQDYLHWSLYISTDKDGATLEVKLPFNEAKFCCGHKWRWYGLDLYELNDAWAAGKEYKLRIVEDPPADRTPEVLGPPLYLEAPGVQRESALVRWVRPQVRNDGAPPGVRYKVQWKTAAGEWGTPAVSQHVHVPRPGNEVLFWRISGLTPGSAYDVRVIAVNEAGDSAPSNVLRVYTDQPFLDRQQQNANAPATGGPGITGTVQAGETLTATTDGIEDEDGLTGSVFSYQWVRSGADIEGAASSTYTMTAADEGKAIQVRVTFTDDAGNAESLTSYAVLSVPPLIIPDEEPPPKSTATREAREAQGEQESAETPLTAAIHDAPESHDGQEDFTFELRFSEEPKEGFSSLTLRDHAFTVTGGEVAGARKLDGDSATPNIRWEISVSPDSNANVTVKLPATEDCEAQGAICTDDGRALSSPLKFTVKGPPLTASTVSVPTSHNGSGEFRFRIAFSEEFSLSYLTLRDDHVFTVEGGKVTGARRLVKGSNIGWEIVVKPDSNGDVTVKLSVSEDCDAQGAICTADGRMLSSPLEFTVSGPGE